MNDDLVFPYAPLLYWSKSWISFYRTHPEWKLMDCAKEVLEMCNYWPGSDIDLQFINLMEGIVDFLKKYNEHVGKENAITIPAIMTSIFAFEHEVNHNMIVYRCERTEAVIITVKSQLSWLAIHGASFKIEPLHYNKKCGFTVGGEWSKPGVTYTFMQKRFNKQWEDVLTEIPKT